MGNSKGCTCCSGGHFPCLGVSHMATRTEVLPNAAWGNLLEDD